MMFDRPLRARFDDGEMNWLGVDKAYEANVYRPCWNDTDYSRKCLSDTVTVAVAAPGCKLSGSLDAIFAERNARMHS